MKTTPVFLTDEQIALFLLFQKHYDAISYMISQGVFEIRQGNAILAFDVEGDLLSIEKQLFARRNKVVPIFTSL